MSRPTVIISPSILVRIVYDLPDGLARLGWEVCRFRPGSPLGSATNYRRANLCLTPGTQGPRPHVDDRPYHLRCDVSIGPESESPVARKPGPWRRSGARLASTATPVQLERDSDEGV